MSFCPRLEQSIPSSSSSQLRLIIRGHLKTTSLDLLSSAGAVYTLLTLVTTQVNNKGSPEDDLPGPPVLGDEKFVGSVVDNGEQFLGGVVDTGDKF